MQLKDRIKELRRVPASELLPNPKNWRTHGDDQRDALKGVLAEIGIADATLARELPDGQLMLIDGHLRAETAGDSIIPVLILDVDEAEADKILLTLDPLAAMAGADKIKLDAILREVEVSAPAVEEMLAELANDAGLYRDEDAADKDDLGDTADVAVAIGGVRWIMPREDYDQWLESVRQSVGFDEPSLIAEFKRRLSMSG